MKIPTLVLFATTLLSQAAPEPLFNGKDLTGWKVTGFPAWSVKDEILVAHNGPEKKASILWTEKEFTNFVFETEFRFSGRIDSGVFLRQENDQIQIGVSGSLKRDMTGSPYIASKKSYPAEAEGVAKLLKEGEWNRMKITAKGNVYTVELNGTKVMEYTSETSIEKGPIGLQVHAGLDMKVEYRKLTLEAL
ncbi:MAG: DUF1080 domain-containing protein [Verrucomicrobiota bacterium]